MYYIRLRAARFTVYRVARRAIVNFLERTFLQ